MSDLTKLQNQYSGLKGSVTRNLKSVDTMLSKLSRLNLDYAKDCHNKATTAINKCKDKAEEIIDYYLNKSMETERLAFESEFDKYFFGTEMEIVRFGDIITTYESSTTKSSSTVSPTTPTSTVKVNLPKLSITPFDGDLQKFTTFFEQFKINIDSKPFDDVQKFTYLISYLKGKALEAIEGLSINSSNYIIAIDILKERFGNKQKLINSHIESLKSLSCLDVCAESLQNFLDKLNLHVRVLDTLGIPKDSYSVLLIPIYATKFPMI